MVHINFEQCIICGFVRLRFFVKLLNNFFGVIAGINFLCSIFVERNGLYSWIPFFISFLVMYIFRGLCFYLSTCVNLYPMYSKIVYTQVCALKLAKKHRPASSVKAKRLIFAEAHLSWASEK